MINTFDSLIRNDEEYVSQVRSRQMPESTQARWKQMQNKIKLVKSPTIAFQSAQSVDGLIQKAKSHKLNVNLEKTLKGDYNLNYLRKTRGDGNCFVRAVAFEYLAQTRSVKLQKCFPHLERVVLTCSEKEYIPKNFLAFYDHEFLSYCLKQNWEFEYHRILRENCYNHRLALAALLAEFPFLDFIIVLYMRALTVLGLRQFQNDPEIKQFLESKDEDKLRNYGNLSDGLTQFLLSKILPIDMNVFEIRQEEVLVYKYRVDIDGKDCPVANLLFQLNHYDLLETEADTAAQMGTPSLQKDDSYYSNNNQEIVEGECLNCEQFLPISIQSCLCQGCYLKTVTALDEFRKTKKISNTLDSNLNIEPESPSKSSFASAQEMVGQTGKQKTKRQKKHRLLGCFR